MAENAVNRDEVAQVNRLCPRRHPARAYGQLPDQPKIPGRSNPFSFAHSTAISYPASACAHPAAVMQRHPGGTAGGIEQGVEQRPVGHGVRAVGHGFGLAIRRSDTAAVQMVAAVLSGAEVSNSREIQLENFLITRMHEGVVYARGGGLTSIVCATNFAALH